MPMIMPIRDLRNTSEISELAHKKQEPIFITKNGYSDLVVMSAELYERFARINRIDQAIFESEKEAEKGGEPILLDAAKEALDRKRFGIDGSAEPEKKALTTSMRGALAQYADPALAEKEKGAWERAAVKKYGPL